MKPINDKCARCGKDIQYGSTFCRWEGEPMHPLCFLAMREEAKRANSKQEK